MSRAGKTAKLAAKLAEAMNAGGVSKAHGAAVTPEAVYPLAAVLVQVDRAVKRNGRKIAAMHAAALAPPTPPTASRACRSGGLTQAAESTLAEIDAALAAQRMNGAAQCSA